MFGHKADKLQKPLVSFDLINFANWFINKSQTCAADQISNYFSTSDNDQSPDLSFNAYVQTAWEEEKQNKMNDCKKIKQKFSPNLIQN